MDRFKYKSWLRHVNRYMDVEVAFLGSKASYKNEEIYLEAATKFLEKALKYGISELPHDQAVYVAGVATDLIIFATDVILSPSAPIELKAKAARALFIAYNVMAEMSRRPDFEEILAGMKEQNKESLDEYISPIIADLDARSEEFGRR